MSQHRKSTLEKNVLLLLLLGFEPRAFWSGAELSLLPTYKVLLTKKIKIKKGEGRVRLVGKCIALQSQISSSYRSTSPVLQTTQRQWDVPLSSEEHHNFTCTDVAHGHWNSKSYPPPYRVHCNLLGLWQNPWTFPGQNASFNCSRTSVTLVCQKFSLSEALFLGTEPENWVIWEPILSAKYDLCPKMCFCYMYLWPSENLF